MEYNSAIKRNELLIHAVTKMNLKSIIIRSQTRKAIYCMIPFIWHSGKDRTTGGEIRRLVAKGWEGGRKD